MRRDGMVGKKGPGYPRSAVDISVSGQVSVRNASSRGVTLTHHISLRSLEYCPVRARVRDQHSQIRADPGRCT